MAIMTENAFKLNQIIWNQVKLWPQGGAAVGKTLLWHYCSGFFVSPRHLIIGFFVTFLAIFRIYVLYNADLMLMENKNAGFFPTKRLHHKLFMFEKKGKVHHYYKIHINPLKFECNQIAPY